MPSVGVVSLKRLKMWIGRFAAKVVGGMAIGECCGGCVDSGAEKEYKCCGKLMGERLWSGKEIWGLASNKIDKEWNVPARICSSSFFQSILTLWIWRMTLRSCRLG